MTAEIAALPYVLSEKERNAEGLARLVVEHPNIRFVSMLAVDLGGNETDERIPAPRSVKDAQALLDGGVETDGSSVVLPGIATLNNAKVDFFADPSCRWYVDYNLENIDEETGLPVGTVMIPAFLRHEGKYVDSRAVLKRAEEYVAARLTQLLNDNPRAARALGIRPNQIDKVTLTIGTEVEFWVRTPGARAEVERLSVSQQLQEQYWRPTKGDIRTGLEQSLQMITRYGMEPEMGHKEVGGVAARVAGSGSVDILEQIEIDWRFSTALQAADNELLVRTMVDRVFAALGLEVTFQAKPIEGVAGNGEHTHVGMAVKMKDGTLKNLFSPVRMDQDYLSEIGFGAIMGLLKHWEAVGAFVTSSTDAFNRLKPGFEAPVCVVTSLGHTVEVPSRNRSVLAGLVRLGHNPLATRFEVRAPNPGTNSYLAIAAITLSMLDGIGAALSSGRTTKELEAEVSKKPGEQATYLRSDRSYRSEFDVFEYYTQEERDSLFGKPPATVVETLANLDAYAERDAILLQGGVFTPEILASYGEAMRMKWQLELKDRIIPNNIETVRSYHRLHGEDADSSDDAAWSEIQGMRQTLVKSIFPSIRAALEAGDADEASRLQLQMNAMMTDLAAKYRSYTANLVDLAPGEAATSANLVTAS